jgi:glycosyltransferase involved in cell wall biosynthesis
LLQQADAYLLPSLSEGFGIALIEAQAIGLKCYASNTVPRATNCGGVEYISLSEGASKWAEIIALDYQSGKCEHQEYDCSRYSVDNIMSEYMKIYGGAIS